MKLARRLDAIEPFFVMEMAKAAAALETAADASAAPMIYLNIGEPDFGAAAAVRAAAAGFIDRGRTPYTQATGLRPLRQALSRWYAERWRLDIDPERIVVTAGASAALQLACLALFEEDDEVLMPDPCYPCNRHFVAATGARAVLLPAGPAERFQLSDAAVQSAWSARTRGVLLASPSNPTGTSVHPSEMRRIAETVRARGGLTLVDEIYLALSFDATYGRSALELGEDIVSINSFSKYFGMTGWRLGWLVLPPALVGPVEKLAQNLYICPSAIAQAAALRCFDTDSIAEYERRRSEFQRRRDFIVPGLERLGLGVPVPPDGAFYAWADVGAHAVSSWDFCHRLMHEARVVLTPGRDFGPAAAERYLRLSFASGIDELSTALDRLGRALRHAGKQATVTSR